MTGTSRAWVWVLLVACETTRHAPTPRQPTIDLAVPSLPVPIIETDEVLPPGTAREEADPSLLDDAEDERPTDEGAVPGVRDLHPHGGMIDCLEMYSACAPDPTAGGDIVCTSAPLELACGQTGTIPTGGAVRCVCP